MSRKATTPMDRPAAARITSAAHNNPGSRTATSGFIHRANAAADRNEPHEDDYTQR